ncbi:P-loop containing nucleoside triphosphate hydrolase protein [Heliocybe sulcata]|uniref:P-loop containing nucleoside triphosphate hydrolase protein n=1 Tax=Heliocybe sulcata TaxID=5364 RepID=A0A5C3MR85_9AGAM|nr:P-loop containing nucleoside triphosphate hydrolase protein [Heliocybe sulcata]
MKLCEGSSLYLQDSCVLQVWSALIPAAFVFFLCLGYASVPPPLIRLFNFLKSPFSEYITLEEAEALDASLEPAQVQDAKPWAPTWRTTALTSIAVIETLAWLGMGIYMVSKNVDGRVGTHFEPILVSISWLFLSLAPILRSKATPRWDLLCLYSIHFAVSIFSVGKVLYYHNVHGSPFPGTLAFVATVADLAGIVAALVLVLQMPTAFPSKAVKKEDIGMTVSPEDYSSLWRWITFHWMYPLISRGMRRSLSEAEVWNLSPVMQSRPIFIKFNALQGSVFRRIWKANSRDLLLDFIGTYISVICNYLGPFFLKRILDSIQDGSKERIHQAYIYALLAFLAQVARAEADVQHLWCSRRASTRIDSELMAAIYAKTLKRKDFSGAVQNGTSEEGKDESKTGKDDEDDKGPASAGKIANLMSHGTGSTGEKIAMFFSVVYTMYAAPFELIIAIVFLYNLLGISAFAGIVLLLLVSPLNKLFIGRTVRIRRGLLIARDKRLSILNELLGAIKLIKFFAWEHKWIERIMEARQKEIQWLIKSRITSIMLSLSLRTIPILVPLVSFFTYVMLGNELTVSVAFTVPTPFIAELNALLTLYRRPMNTIPSIVLNVLTIKLDFKRFGAYLEEEEVSNQVSSLNKVAGSRFSDVAEGLGIVDGTFSWNGTEETEQGEDNLNGQGKKKDAGTAGASPAPDSPRAGSTKAGARFQLQDINIMIPEGKLTLVTGPTASGKTALLTALLGEMTRLSGRVIMSKDTTRIDSDGLMHTISYAAQTPWLRHQSIRDNILFGYPYEERRYEDVLDACALKPDLDVLEDGDLTEIGARGISLSGGQKARVALARAIYARTKYVLLDDPLSAVDSHTARHLFEMVLKGPLLRNRTVVLVTHHVELVLPGTDYVIYMSEGRIETQGSVEELRERGMLDDVAREGIVNEDVDERVITQEKTEEDLAVEVLGADTSKGEVEKKKPRKLVEDEHRAVGAVKWSTYRTYLKASSYWTWATVMVLVLLMEIWVDAYGSGPEDMSHLPLCSRTGLAVAEPFIHHSSTVLPLRAWCAYTSRLPSAQNHPLFYVEVYAAIGLALMVINLASRAVEVTGALRASRLLFRQLLASIARATMRWHDVTPQGRMLNRFSQDMTAVDSQVSSSVQDVNTSLAGLLASVVTISVIFPAFLVPACALGLMYRFVSTRYLNISRELRRMESNSFSPVFSGFGELLEGIVTVRAFSAEQRFLDELHGRIDSYIKMGYTIWMTNRWLLLNFEILGAGVVLFATLFSLSGLVSAGVAGICITSAMDFTMNVYWVCRFWTEMELDLNSVERVAEYLDLPQEAPAIIESNRPPAYWPSSSSGHALLSVEDLVIKYAPELPPVLRGVSLQLVARERVGLLGRTGSGKSTLAMSILRFVDPASGRILIDGIDISTIGVHDLRSRITYIPQDATLFSGTLRDNLDPFNEHSNEECLDVLYRVRMISKATEGSQESTSSQSRAPSIQEVTRATTTVEEAMSSTSAGIPSTKDGISLEMQISAGGLSLSQGQRQLVALARALLRRSSVIILDEATSSIGLAADKQIQETIRQEFKDSLLLTVAHRLKTVIDYDRLIILDNGRIAEFDTPYNLIQKEDGVFRRMCLKSGSFLELEGLAKAKAECC